MYDRRYVSCCREFSLASIRSWAHWTIVLTVRFSKLDSNLKMEQKPRRQSYEQQPQMQEHHRKTYCSIIILRLSALFEFDFPGLESNSENGAEAKTSINRKYTFDHCSNGVVSNISPLWECRQPVNQCLNVLVLCSLESMYHVVDQESGKSFDCTYKTFLISFFLDKNHALNTFLIARNSQSRLL